jgi:FtsZ-binding cell division protein ZapB
VPHKIQHQGISDGVCLTLEQYPLDNLRTAPERLGPGMKKHAHAKKNGHSKKKAQAKELIYSLDPDPKLLHIEGPQAEIDVIGYQVKLETLQQNEIKYLTENAQRLQGENRQLREENKRFQEKHEVLEQDNECLKEKWHFWRQRFIDVIILVGGTIIEVLLIILVQFLKR